MSSSIRQQQYSLSTEYVPLISDLHYQPIRTWTKLDDESERLLQIKNVVVSLHRPSSRPYHSYFLPIPTWLSHYFRVSGRLQVQDLLGSKIDDCSKPENATRLSQMKFISVYSWLVPPLILGIIGFPLILVFYHKFYAYPSPVGGVWSCVVSFLSFSRGNCYWNYDVTIGGAGMLLGLEFLSRYVYLFFLL